jgi:hypothetical protein
MLRNEDISKIVEIKGLYTDKWIQPDFLSNLIGLLKVSPSSKLFTSVKPSGVQLWVLLNTLLIFPFMDIKNIGSYFSSSLSNKAIARKDTLYRILKNQKINWRSILSLFVMKYLDLDKSTFDTKSNTEKCIIIDDTDIEKSGKTIEGISKIFNHVTKRFIYGYKLLVMGYWNGSVFIPVDFSFHRENKKNKFGLNTKQRKAQHKTKRGSKSTVLKRFKELNIKKTDMLVQMFRRINKRAITIDYILIDSWFTSISLVKKLKAINEKVDIIGMYKYNSKLTFNKKQYSLKELRKTGKIKRSRAKNYQYKMFVVKIDEIDVKLFFVRKGNNGKWHTILSTNTSLSFTKTLKIYSIRWTVEVFFREVKQLLGLEKIQSTNFDIQVAQTTIIMIQYLLISLKYRIEAYGTIGGLFKDLKQDYIEHRLNERILVLITDLSNVLEFLLGEDQTHKIISVLTDYSDGLKFIETCNLKDESLKLVA